MPNIAFVNGEFLPESEAKVSIFDRGFLFADAVYEVFPVFEGAIADSTAHFQRLERSLNELEIPAPMSEEEYRKAIVQLIGDNELDEGLVYMQVSRGPAERSFDMPENPTPTVVMFCRPMEIEANPMAVSGKKVITTQDLRWKRCDIKTVALLAASLAKSEATKAGVDDAWFVDDDDMITEGSSNNAYIINAEGVLVTRPLSNQILPGVTRISVLKLVEEKNLILEERNFSVEEAKSAIEAFTSSATGSVMPVVEIDGQKIGDGLPGPHTKRLRALYTQMAKESARSGS